MVSVLPEAVARNETVPVELLVILPLPAIPKLPVLWIVMLVPAVAAEIVPGLDNVPPLTFIVMLLLDETVTLELTLVLPVVVVVTAAPFKLRVVAPPPESWKVKDGAVIAIGAPEVEIVAADPDGDCIAREVPL